MIAAIALLAALQGQAPEITASVDRPRVSVGEEFTYTVRARSGSTAPMEVLLAPLTGFEIVSRSEQTQVDGLAQQPSRSTTVEVQLRALRPGTWQLAPAIARQGGATARSSRITISVSAGGTSGAAALSPRVGALLERAPPPPGGAVAVTLVLSEETVRVGEQIDVVTIAWFPRELRLQMRRPPVLQPPALEGVWSYPQPVPPGVAVSRRVGGMWYDLFVMHQVVFPLVPGAVRTEGATLRYSVPLALQFFSQEERFTRTSGPALITVLPLPEAGRPDGFEGAVGSGLTIARSDDLVRAEARRAFSVDYVVEGSGNVALWPAPELDWPAGLRAYPDQVDERTAVTDGRLTGRKSFRYLVVPDSSGTFPLPAARYPYFDAEAATYRVARSAAGRVIVAAPTTAAGARVAPPPLMTARSRSLAALVDRAIPGWVWLLVALLPPLAVLARRYDGMRRRRGTPVSAAPDAGTPRAAERALDAALASLVPAAATRAGPGLAAALRAAGVAEPLVARTVAVRDRLLAHRYGPAAGGEAEQLVRDTNEVVSELATSRRSRRSRRSLPVGVATVWMLIALGAGTSAAQQGDAAAAGRPDAEALYARGAMREAADAFARRAAAEPDVATHWYNLGAAWYQLGDDARASVAWTRAARLAPRNGTIARALRLVPPPDAPSARALRVLPVTPGELALVAALVWLSGWVVLALRPAARRSAAALLVAAGVIAAGALLEARARARPVGVLLTPTALRVSPHHRAPALQPLEAGAALRPLRSDGAWTLAEAGDGRRGWLPLSTLSVLRD